MLVSGCSRTGLVIEHAAATYTMDQAVTLAPDAGLGSASGLDRAAASARRQELLANLRRQGAEGTAVADMLTVGFPADYAGVPVLVRKATVDGTPSWIVVDAVPGKDDKLTRRRIWVFNASTGTVTGSSASR